MVSEASVPGIFRTLLIIVGAIVLLRFLGQVMIAKRNMEAERNLNKQKRSVENERNEKLRNFGRTKIINSGNKKTTSNNFKGDVEDVEYEELP